ncbi:futalosine hydrolase [Salibacterium qingdaonense]|uniref:Futalosine hydrolase n=1 Tax=Salibacterium qingdaonense TaxID=266892 RepID=A0A1I4HVI2_9BACI|nr:futalosine hydrolase [Salibacterium qingdaonense]SFL46185.1 futalosine hydrolase [Salibacterium qingdaonense]
MEEGKILIVTAVDKEAEVIHKGLENDPRFVVEAGGAGMAEAAVSTASALQNETYKAVINAGIAGAFQNSEGIGSIVAASEIIAAEAGAEAPDGFLSMEHLGLGASRYHCDPAMVEQMREQAEKAGMHACTGPILTTMTATGTHATADRLRDRFPGARAEAMEGFGVAAATRRQNIPVFEVRAVSNAVGPRDRDNWDIPAALAALEQMSPILREVF